MLSILRHEDVGPGGRDQVEDQIVLRVTAYPAQRGVDWRLEDGCPALVWGPSLPVRSLELSARRACPWLRSR
jgi:hypothetical protein